MCRQRSSLLLILILALALTDVLQAATPDYSIEEAVTRAQAQNPDIAIARKKVQAARGGLISGCRAPVARSLDHALRDVIPPRPSHRSDRPTGGKL